MLLFKTNDDLSLNEECNRGFHQQPNGRDSHAEKSCKRLEREDRGRSTPNSIQLTITVVHCDAVMSGQYHCGRVDRMALSLHCRGDSSVAGGVVVTATTCFLARGLLLTQSRCQKEKVRLHATH